jgi:hypothetical protein
MEHCNEWRQRPSQEIWGVLTGSTRLKETERRYKKLCWTVFGLQLYNGFNLRMRA